MSWAARSYKRFKSSQQQLAEPLLFDKDDDLAILDNIDQIMADDQMVELPTYFDHQSSKIISDDDSDSTDDDESKSPKEQEEEEEIGENTEVAKLKEEGTNNKYNSNQPKFDRRTTAKAKIDEDIELSRKYEKYLTIDNDEIIDKNDKIDALILQLKLPHIYTLPDDEQYEVIQEKYSWIDDEDGEIDQFQYEEIQEVVSHMTAIERRHMYDTIEKYDEV